MSELGLKAPSAKPPLSAKSFFQQIRKVCTSAKAHYLALTLKPPKDSVDSHPTELFRRHIDLEDKFYDFVRLVGFETKSSYYQGIRKSSFSLHLVVQDAKEVTWSFVVHRVRTKVNPASLHELETLWDFGKDAADAFRSIPNELKSEEGVYVKVARNTLQQQVRLSPDFMFDVWNMDEFKSLYNKPPWEVLQLSTMAKSINYIHFNPQSKVDGLTLDFWLEDDTHIESCLLDIPRTELIASDQKLDTESSKARQSAQSAFNYLEDLYRRSVCARISRCGGEDEYYNLIVEKNNKFCFIHMNRDDSSCAGLQLSLHSTKWFVSLEALWKEMTVRSKCVMLKAWYEHEISGRCETIEELRDP